MGLSVLAASKETNPFAVWPVGAHKKALQASGLELAVWFGMPDVVKALLNNPNATPQALAKAQTFQGPFAPEGLLALAIANNDPRMAQALMEKGWDPNAQLDNGKWLAASVRSAEMLGVLVEGGLSKEVAKDPTFQAQLAKALKPKELSKAYEIMASKSKGLEAPDDLDMRQLKSFVTEILAPNWGFDYMDRPSLLNERDGLIDRSQAPIRDWRIPEARGACRGVLSPAALLARMVNEHYNAPLAKVVSIIDGMEAKIFGGPVHYVRDGLPDLGLWALVMAGQHKEDESEILSGKSKAFGHRLAHKALARIEALHPAASWEAWRKEAAVTLSKTPSSEGVRFVNQWLEGIKALAEEDPFEKNATKALNLLEEGLSEGVLWFGAPIQQFLLEKMDERYHRLKDVDGFCQQRDRLILASLGVEKRLSARALGNSGSSSVDQALRTEMDLFRAAMNGNFNTLKSNPALNKMVRLGIPQAIKLGYANVQALRAVQLDDVLPEAPEPVTPRPRL